MILSLRERCVLEIQLPLPHVFGLRRLQSNPPRSLWLQHIHWMCCLTRRAHTVVPTRKGTHGDRSAWGHTDAIDFVAIASSLQATNGIRGVCNTNRLKAVPLRFVRQLRNNTAQSLVLRTQGLPHGKNKRTSACISKMKAKFLSCGKRSTKNPGEQLQLVVVEAKGACVRRKLGAPRLAAVAARNPSSNMQIPCISAL